MAGTNDMHPIADRWGRLRNFDFCSETEPTQTWPYMIWINPASQEIKVRNWADTAWIGVGGSAGADEKVKVSADDALAGYLLPKLDAGTGIQLTELNPGAAEQVRIASTVSLDDAYNAGRIITADAGAVEIQGAGGLLSQGNIVLDDGVGDSPQVQLVGGSNDDTVLMYLRNSAVANESDFVIRLPGAGTGSQLRIETNLGGILAYFTGDGHFRLDHGDLTVAAGKGTFTDTAASVIRGNVSDAVNDDVTEILRLLHVAGGVVAGFGARLTYRLSDAAANEEDAAAIDARWDDPTNGSEDSRLQFMVRVGGAALAEQCRIDGTGLVMAAGKNISIPDNSWIGLTGGGRIEFDSQAIDEVNFLNCYVGIGTSTPEFVLDVGPTGSACARIGRAEIGQWPPWANVAYFGNQDLDHTQYGNYALIQNGSGATSLNSATGQSIRFNENNVFKMILTGGQLGIGTENPDRALDVIGIIQASNLLGGATNLTTNASGDIIRDPSDARLKEDVRDIDSALDKTLRLRGVSFKWKSESQMGDDRYYGLIAQQVAEVVPELVSRSEDGWMGVRYTNMVALLVEAIKEQQRQIAALSARLEKVN